MTGAEASRLSQLHSSLFYRPAALLLILLAAWGAVSLRGHLPRLPLVEWLGGAPPPLGASPPHTSSIVKWAAAPDALAYLTPHSRCLLDTSGE